MRVRISLLALLFVAGTVIAPAAQAPAGTQRVHGNLLQVMRGVLFPASNVLFAAQDDPATMKEADDPSTSPNPLTSVYGQWQAVENAGIALAESANLLTIPGRNCSNGRPAPVGNPDWQKFVQGLRDAGMEVLKAGQARNVDQVVSAADTLTTACGNCHDVYREKTPAQGGPANRCVAS